MRTPVLFALMCVLLGAPVAMHAQREKFSLDDLDYIEKTWPHARKTNTGIRYVIERPGHGERPVPGQFVAVLYVGHLLHEEKPFDQAQDPHRPLAFRLGRGYVIQGWDQVLQLMQVGEKRLVIIPPELGYGARGQAPSIPPDSTLVFEVELIAVKSDA